MQKIFSGLLLVSILSMHACKATDLPISPDSTSVSIKLHDFQNASLVIGQADFISAAGNRGASGPAEDTLAGPFGNVAVANGELFIPDSSNHRVLGFNSFPSANGFSADFAIGQPDLSTGASGTSPDTLSGPQTVAVYDGKLFALDYGNNRLLIWNHYPTGQSAADVVVGQEDFSTPSSGCAANRLSSPESFQVVGGKLIIADSGNQRVLVWNQVPTTNGFAADLVLGQPDFATCSVATVSATSFHYPTGLWSDGTRLVVPDYSNHRVLAWNHFPSSIQQPADFVLGQPNMNSNAPLPASARDLNGPYFVTSNGQQLFVSEDGNDRITIWDGFPTVSYQPADKVLGQSDLNHGIANDDDQDGVSDAHPTARTLNLPAGLVIMGNNLIVTDAWNSRVLVFKGE